MWYRHVLDCNPDRVTAIYVFESFHGDLYRGHDRDGETKVVTFDATPFADRLASTEQAYPNPARDGLRAELWAAADATLGASGEKVAGKALAKFEPPANVPTLEELEEEAKQLTDADGIAANMITAFGAQLAAPDPAALPASA